MTRTKLAVVFLFTAVVIATLWACSKNSGEETGTSNDTFKSGMLTNYADAVIIPAYEDLQVKLNALDAPLAAFLAAPSTNTQNNLKPAFKAAYISYESVSAAAFGPASALLFNSFFNTFPCSPSKIEAAVETGNYNLEQAGTADSLQGFPTLDYLLFASDAVTKFTGAGAAKRTQYAQALTARMKTLLSAVLSKWKTEGYRASFIASLKTDVGSSIGSMVNQFAFEMDAMKGPRIGWPFGKMSNGIVFADKCEGYYAGITGDLAIANLTSLKNYYTGGAGTGIDDYLVLLKKEQLNKDVLAQFDVVLAALKAIPAPMSAAFTNNKPLIEEAYKQVQKLLTLLKTDVASATAVQITYMDNDGD